MSLIKCQSFPRLSVMLLVYPPGERMNRESVLGLVLAIMLLLQRWGNMSRPPGSMGFFDFVKCFTGFHDWTAWGFDNDYSCNQTRVCRSCWRYSTIQVNHSWTDFKYIASDSCEQERTCTRCNQKGKRTAPHNWGEPERDFTQYIYKCIRCKETHCEPLFSD